MKEEKNVEREMEEKNLSYKQAHPPCVSVS